MHYSSQDHIAAPFRPEISRDETALLLDIDGTLLDFAPTPREVWVSPDLLRTLKTLHTALHGAVAFVSGRSVSDIDLIFSPLLLPAVGGHGAEFRPNIELADDTAPPPLPAAIKREFAIIAKLGRGVLVEDKGYAIALHYRLAPDLGDKVIAAVKSIRDRLPAGTIDMMLGKFVVEVTPAGITKATGVRAMMAQPNFAGRKPIFVGDDTTDETVFPVMPHYGGKGFSVGRSLPNTDGFFLNPGAVRGWLIEAAASFRVAEPASAAANR